MSNFMMLFLEKNNNGKALTLRADAPTLPVEFDALTESLIVSHPSVPCAVFSGQHYSGQVLALVKGGGSNDLSTLPGNWHHKIRSVKFSHLRAGETDGNEVELSGDVEGVHPEMVAQSTDGVALEKVGSEPAPSPISDLDLPQVTVADGPATTPTEVFYERTKAPISVRAAWMERVFNRYQNSCVCGTKYDNNCAHYLSNAMALEGATFPSGLAKCPSGRPVRAKELLGWFKGISTGFQSNHNSISSGYWFVYQESGGQGHVAIHLESASKYWWRGTGDYPNWPVQWHYFY